MQLFMSYNNIQNGKSYFFISAFCHHVSCCVEISWYRYYSLVQYMCYPDEHIFAQFCTHMIVFIHKFNI